MTVDWNPPQSWQRISCIEAHTAGEPLRVITAGLPDIPGETIIEKRRHAQQHLDNLRTALMWEPRGHPDMYGCIPTEPVTSDGHLGVLFLHNEGFSTMCGHGIIGLAKVGLETGLIPVSEMDIREDGRVEIRMDTPAGRVTAHAHFQAGQVGEVSFLNVPSFVYALDQAVEVPGHGVVRYDVAFGGAFYAFVDAVALGLELNPQNHSRLIDAGVRIKRAVMQDLPIEHPLETDLGFLYGTIFVGRAHDPQHHSRNVCIFADGEVDRCPTGTGVSARAALHLARGELELGQSFTVESILGTTFTGQAVERARYGSFEAVIPRVSGRAHITGKSEWLIDPSDPLRQGFLLR
jgi:trans-L-3-hydroxyproline dehydratase